MISGKELRSTVNSDGQLTLSIEQVLIPEPNDDEIIVRVEAAPMNPTDVALLVGGADLASASLAAGPHPQLKYKVPQDALAALSGRHGLSIAVGLEGAGTVIAAGREAKALEGRIVATMSGGMFTQYRKIAARDAIPLPAGVSSSEGASIVNPLTALGMMETAKLEGHGAIVHTAAASNLGQMMQKACAEDGIPLVNIVRSQDQMNLLRAIGAVHVLNSTDSNFTTLLVDAIAETGATIAFDALGGGTMGDRILQAMEAAAVRKMSGYVRTGSDIFKQLYIYGALDLSPTVFHRPAFGYRWGAAGWIIYSFLRESDPSLVARLTERMLSGIKTMFASSYTRVISLEDVLLPEIVSAFERKATGEKYLIDPSRS